MYIPKHHHWVFPTANILAGFYFQHNYPGLDVVVFVQIPLVFIGCTHAWYILQAGIMYQAYITRLDAKPAHQEPAPAPRNVPNLSETTYEQVIPLMKFDKVRQFSKTVLAMLDFGSVDLREDRWKEHFGSRGAYVEVRTKFETAGGFARKDTRLNSPFIVRDRHVVELVAGGNKDILQ